MNRLHKRKRVFKIKARRRNAQTILERSRFMQKSVEIARLAKEAQTYIG